MALVSGSGLGDNLQVMTTEEIQEYINLAIRGGFKGVKMESGEVMTSEGVDGRFLGKVMATRY